MELSSTAVAVTSGFCHAYPRQQAPRWFSAKMQLIMKRGRGPAPCRMINKTIANAMKLTILLLTIAFLNVNATGWSQNISFSGKNVQLKKVLTDIEKQTGFVVLYGKNLLQTAKPVTLNVTDIPLKDFLDIVFRNQPLKYLVDDNTIFISPRPDILTPEASNHPEHPGTDIIPAPPVTGVIRDSTGAPLAGATVSIKGKQKKVLTDEKGHFVIDAEPGDILLVSYIGFQPATHKVGNNTKTINLQLTPNLSSEAEVVIATGYQEIKKTRMTGSTETITAKDIANKGYTNVEEILKGQMAGVATMSLSGRPGAQSQIRIRGINSLTGDSNPIWIVDGMPLQGDVPRINMGGTEFQETVLTSGIGNIPPDDIESITVLKDAAATAIYGSRAANGVIVVKTKRGSAGQSFINIQSSYAVTEAPKNRLVMMNSKEKIAFERGIYEDFPGLNLGGRVQQLLKKADNGLITRAEAEKEIARLGTINTNWFDELFRRGTSQNHSITLSGGSERTQYYSSISYLGQQGVMPNNKYESMSGNLKLTHDFNERLRINADIRSTVRNDRSSASQENPLNYATYANPYERLYDENGKYAYDRSYYPELSTVRDGYKYDFNILEDMKNNTANSKYLSNQINLKLEYKIMNGLMISSMGTFSNSNTHTMREMIPGSFSSKYSSWLSGVYAEKEVPDYLNNGSMSEATSRSQGWTIRNQLEFARGFSKGDHYVTAYLGQEVSSQMGYGFSSMIPEWNPTYGVATYPDLIGMPIASSLSFTSLGSHTETQDRSVSFFSTGSYSYKDRYVLSGSARLDGVDIIGTENRFSPLWNISGKWNMHKESFMEDLTFIDQLAFRFSYGYTGSIDRNALPFSTLRKVGNLVYDGEKLLDRYLPSSPSVKWQRKEDRNLGFDASLFRNKVNLTVNYYNNNTRNLIDLKKIASSTGRTEVLANVASLNNTGWEISLKTMNVYTKDFSWTTSFNFTTNKNIVTETYIKNLNEYTVNGNSTFEDIYSLYIQGHSVKSFYAYPFAGVDPYSGATLAYVNGFDAKGNPLGSLNAEGKYVFNMDENLTSQLAHASRRYIGESYPPITGGFSTQLNYKRFSLSTQFTFMTGHLARSFQSYGNGTVSGSTRNVLAIEANRWRKPGDITDIPKYANGRTEYLYQLFDFRFEDGSFIKCNNISFGYNLPQNVCDRLNLTRTRFNFNLANAFTITKYRGIDPENMGAFGYPSAKRYNFSVSVGI